MDKIKKPIISVENPFFKNNTRLDLCINRIDINQAYCKEWHITMEDFVSLTCNGELLKPVLYRIGGLNTLNLAKDRYIKLIKHVEAYYPKEILEHSNNSDPKHLEGRWCILDSKGVEKIECKQFECPYIVKDSCIYSMDKKYYNIETKKLYCEASTAMESTSFLFLENRFDRDESKRGVLKINKVTGDFTLFN